MKKKLWGVLSAVTLLASAVFWGDYSFVQADVAIKDNVQNEATSDTIIIGVEGINKTNDMQILLDKVNAVRREACYAGNVPDPRYPSEMLEPSDYVPMKIGVNCNKAAIIRAAEGAIRLDHTRPNGDNCFTVLNAFGTSGGGENLAWTGDSYSDGNHNTVICFDENANEIQGWIDEKENWIKYGNNSVALPAGEQMGHYKTLINPSFVFTGMASFNPTNDSVSWDWTCTAGSYAYAGGDVAMESLPGVQSETYIQKIPVLISSVKSLDIAGESILNKGEQYKYDLLVSVYFSGAAANTTVDCPVYDGVTWSSSDSSVISVDQAGKITVNGTGKASITASIGSGTSKKTITREVFAVPEGVTVEGVENPEMVTTNSMKKPVLSKTAKAVLSDGSKVDVDVVWEGYSTSNLETFFTSREFDVRGTALGMEVVQKVHVNAANIKKLINIYYTRNNSNIEITKEFEDGEVITTDSGTKPTYPSVEVVFDNGYSYYPFSVTWDSKSLEYYKDRKGGDFVLTGKASFNSDDGTVKYDVTQPLHVNPATVTNVKFKSDGATITTESGVEPEYPKATVTWSNGDVTEEDIVWTNPAPADTYTDLSDASRKYMMKDGGTYQLTGSYNGNNTTITVNVAPASATIASIKASESSEIVPCGTAPSLPGTATVVWSNGDSTSENINWSWNPDSEEDHDKFEVLEGNEFDITGDCKGYTITKTVTVNPATIKSIDDIEMIHTVQGIAPKLPEKVNVHWSNGVEREEPISWNSIPESSYASPNTEFVVKGKVYDFDENDYDVQASVYVDEKRLKSIAWEEGSPSSFTSYYLYNKSDFVGKIIAEFDNGTYSEPIEVTPEMITGFDADSTDSTQEITVSFTVSGITKQLKAEMKLIKRTGIEVATLPSKTEYIEDQSFSTDGIVINEILDNGVHREIPSEDYDKVTYTGFNSLPDTYGNQTVICSIYGLSDTFEVSVSKKVLQGIEITRKPNKLTYVQGQELDLTGIKVMGTYDNGKSYEEEITKDDIWINSNDSAGDMGERFNTDTLGSIVCYVWKLVSVVDIDGRVSKSYVGNIFSVEVIPREATSIEWDTLPSRVSFPQNDVTFADYSFSDAKLKVNFNDDTSEIVEINKAEITGFDISKLGKQTATVTYDNKKLTFDAEVTAPKVVNTYVEPPTKTGYAEGETLELDGAKIVFEYDNGLSDSITLDPDASDIELSFTDGSDIDAPLSVTGGAAEKSLAVTYKGESLKTKSGLDAIPITIARRTGIRVVTPPTAHIYPEGTDVSTFVLTGIELEAVFDNGSVSPVPEKDIKLAANSDFDSSVLGKQCVYVEAYGFTASYEVTIREKRVSRASIETPMTKLEYVQGQPLDMSGMKVKANYDNGTTGYIEVTEDNLKKEYGSQNEEGTPFTTDVISPNPKGTTVYVIIPVEQDIGIRYLSAGTMHIVVQKKVVQSVELTGLPDKLSLPQNLKGFDYSVFNDGELKAFCNCDYTEELKFSDEAVTLSGLDITQVGEQTVTVSYGGKTATFDVEVTEPVLTAKTVTPPTKTSYTEGEKVSLAGAAVVKTYDNGQTETIDLSQDASKLEAEGVKVCFVDAKGNEYAIDDPAVTTTSGAKTLVVKYRTSEDGEPETYEEIKMPGGAAVKVDVKEKAIPVNPSGGNNGNSGSNGNSGNGAVNKLVSDGNGSRCVKADGSYAKSEWVTINGKQYYFNADTYAASNEWRDGKWINADGSCDYAGQLLWKSNATGWWVEDTVGWYPTNSWQKIDGLWYYFNASGYMASGEYYNGYWFNKDGSWDPQYKLSWRSNLTGWWVEDISGWWPSGSWLKVDGYWYYFDASGYMVTSQYVDGWWISADGVCY